MQQFTNRTYDEIEVGASDSVTRTLTATEVEALSLVAGDVESFHLDLADDAMTRTLVTTTASSSANTPTTAAVLRGDDGRSLGATV